ncbi:MAG: (Fe-S)-binding protein [Deltaproteobacteria bacterium]|nr:(Fe-S)-binding protein [Deltaproteobacteria bacterium]
MQIFYEYIKDGRIKLDPDKRVTEPATYQDPCNISRSGGLWEQARWLMNTMCTDFRDMTPNREYNHCCGGGGGSIPMGPEFRKRRIKSGNVKVDQIRETGAKVLIVPCHNCYDQINDLNKEFELGLKVMHFKTIISENMIIPDELKPDEEE